MQSLNNPASSSSAAKSTAALALFGGSGTAPRGSESSGANFAQMLRETAHASPPAAPVATSSGSPAASEPAGAKPTQEASASAKKDADAAPERETQATPEQQDAEAKSPGSNTARSEADQQTRKTRRAAQEREQAASRQAETRQAAHPQGKADKPAAAADGMAEAAAAAEPASDATAAETADATDAASTPLAAEVLALLQQRQQQLQQAQPQGKAQADDAASAPSAAAVAGPLGDATGHDGKAGAKALAQQAGETKGAAAKGLRTDAADAQPLGETPKLAESAQSFQHALHEAQAGSAVQAQSPAAAAGKAGNEAGVADKPRVALSAPPDSPQFAPEMAARVSVLAADGVQQAELHLNPAEMGPVSVQIVVDGQQAQVSFIAEQGQTRSALEAGLPDLASALREQGLTLAGGGVFQQSPGNSHGERQASADGTAGGRRDSTTERDTETSSIGTVGATATRRASRGVVDLYA